MRSQAGENDRQFMRMALEEADAALAEGEVPVGAVLVRNGEVIARAHNYREQGKDPTAHAEVLCLRKASELLGGWNLHDTVLYVTLEPCPMCAGAIICSRVSRVVFGCFDSRAGSFGSVVNLSYYPYNHRPEIQGGVLADESKERLTSFFVTKRRKKNN